jgi:exo-beta-1,3-glucanase (GH17 family)
MQGLEERTLLALAPVLTALTTYRYWVDYAPSYNSSDAPYNPNPSDARIKADLENLYKEGFRGVVTYTLQGSYANIPKIAKSVGFQWVIAGIYNPADAAEVKEAKSPNVLPYTDAFVVGNEGLTEGRYNYKQLTTAINEVEKETDKPVTTSEPGGAYYAGSKYSKDLLGLGSWLFPNIDYFLWDNKPSAPAFMWKNVSFVYQFMLTNDKTPGPVVAKETAYPTAGGAVASEANQIAWFKDYAAAKMVDGKPFYFVYFEAYDQPWKTKPTAYEPHMGLNGINNSNGSRHPKPAIAALEADIRSKYPG